MELINSGANDWGLSHKDARTLRERATLKTRRVSFRDVNLNSFSAKSPSHPQQHTPDNVVPPRWSFWL
jgi:hypothetical protein